MYIISYYLCNKKKNFKTKTHPFLLVHIFHPFGNKFNIFSLVEGSYHGVKKEEEKNVSFFMITIQGTKGYIKKNNKTLKQDQNLNVEKNIYTMV